MKHHRHIIHGFAVTLVLGLAAARAMAADASAFNGTWTTSFDSQVGVQTYTYTFKVEGDKLTGRARSDNGDYEIANGKVDGDTISFVENMDYQGMQLAISYQGKLVAPDQIQFKRDVGGMGGEEFVAKKQK
ncbi:MAG: hypothetical protein DIU62_005275 [Pseudomonadota bacterium]|jgi:hypothetical protein|nr:MAG: hypothetical protein DIU62_15005 [Pseudomonadota bacterium]